MKKVNETVLQAFRWIYHNFLTVFCGIFLALIWIADGIIIMYV